MRLSSKNWKDYFWLKVNKAIRVLIISDILMISGFGLVSPIFAIYITEQIEGGSVEVVGIAATIYLLVRSLGQLPVAEVIDRIKGELDDYWLLVIGSVLTSLVPLLYLVATTPIHLYLIQVLYGLLAALILPTWYAIFTRHIDKSRVGVEWSIYTTLTDLSSAAAAAIGGYLAFSVGFAPLFVIVSIVAMCGSLALIIMHKEMRQPKHLFGKR